MGVAMLNVRKRKIWVEVYQFGRKKSVDDYDLTMRGYEEGKGSVKVGRAPGCQIQLESEHARRIYGSILISKDRIAFQSVGERRRLTGSNPAFICREDMVFERWNKFIMKEIGPNSVYFIPNGAYLVFPEKEGFPRKGACTTYYCDGWS